MIGFGAREIELFRSLSNVAGSGIPLQRALEIVGKSRPELEPLRRRIEEGTPASEALAASAHPFERWQIEIVRVGEATGRLDSAFRLIADLLEERRSFALSLLSGFAYPLFLLHVAPLMLYGSLLVAGQPFAFALSVAGFLFWFYAPAALLYVAWKKGGASGVASLPLLNSFAKAQFCFYLSALIRAAVPLRKALDLSAEAAGVRGIADSPPGETVVEQLSRYRMFSDEELARIQVAEESGKLDEDLARLSVQAREKWQTVMKAATAVLPPLVYLIVGIAIAYRIVSFYNDYFGALNGVFR